MSSRRFAPNGDDGGGYNFVAADRDQPSDRGV